MNTRPFRGCEGKVEFLLPPQMRQFSLREMNPVVLVRSADSVQTTSRKLRQVPGCLHISSDILLKHMKDDWGIVPD